MSIRLSKELEKAQGFTLRLSNMVASDTSAINSLIKGYDLDAIFADYNRTDPDRSITLEVKNDEGISESVIEELKSDAMSKIGSSLSDVTGLKDNIIAIMKKVFNQYHFAYDNNSDELRLDSIFDGNIPTKAYSQLNYEINQYLSGLCGDNLYSFTISFPDTDDQIHEILISYDYSGSDELNEQFDLVYKKYVNEYLNALWVSQEAGLAIDGSEKGPITIKEDDFKKYLLNGEENGGTSTTQSTVSSKRPLIIWENGTSDANSGDDIETVYEILADLEAKVAALANTTSSTDVDSDWALTTDSGTVPTTGAVYSYIEGRFERIDILKPYDYVINNENKIDVYNTLITNSSFTINDPDNGYYTMGILSEKSYSIAADSNENYYFKEER